MMHPSGKQDRIQALQVFSEWQNHEIKESLTASQMQHIYANSKFVIVGRGWNTIDCLRIYESIISGAIPVVVSRSDEIAHTFAFNNDMPPLVFANTWHEALDKCRRMNETEIDQRRLDVVKWYQHKIISIHEKILHTFNISIDNS